ncbi:2-oxo acid dehydrogenase subunit E2 [Nocardia rhizosphaerihabitans]|uniref:Dihydrolipoamide acetyltransferase component of pyruvate dehydrogenase complex n=1 Tax=Nocardia rhizosphaerihabitans TaxID=1691570 RepID=A0ABQ2KV80_9NOCA|nr:2-oxo acid dehydrogenase subunit E2 [Nocardia rhizosphaerihabitans]GGN93775.1 dihydrolipoamide acetyltransferase component of pyruvate dehydrogenase complex [Nocardia rhizosphaerihabitans]
MAEFRMPSLGADMEQGTLLQWRVGPGDVVHKGDIVAEVDTTKAAIEVECFEDGTIGELLVPEGTTVPVGTVLATIRPVDHPATEHPSSLEQPASDSAPREVTGPTPIDQVRATPLIRRLAQEAGIDLSTVHGSGPDGRVLRGDIDNAVAARDIAPDSPRTDGATHPSPHIRASGRARDLATRRGVDLSALHGTGPDGAIRSGDVEQASEQGPPIEVATPPPSSGGPRDRAAIRRAVVTAMTRSKQTIPHYYLSATIDLDAATAWLHAVNEAAPVQDRMIMAAVQMRAVALAALAVPELNGHWFDDVFHPSGSVDLGVIVSLRGGGLIAPTIVGADTIPLRELMVRLRGAVDRARSARLLSSDAAPASITVTNLGDLGVDTVFGVIPPPQVAIVGLGAVSQRPCAVNGLLGVRPQVTITLSADHRASDGAVGARFLNTIGDLLQHPEQL